MISRTSASPPRSTWVGADSNPSDRHDDTVGAAAASKALPPWQRSLGQAVRSLDDLLAALDLDVTQLPGGTDRQRAAAQQQFPLRVPRAFVDRMQPGDPNDPLLRQVLPRGDEMSPQDGYVLDPLAEAPASPLPGLLHKYAGRVLLITTGACAVHCRYCFRRHFPYDEHRPGRHTADLEPWQAALDYIAADPTIDEVILSGGDPLSLHDDKLARLASALEDIPHLRRLRLHTRLPIVLPERVDSQLLRWLDRCRLQKVIVMHANHGNEIDDNVGRAAESLRRIGVTLLNQAVLLRGVNDSVEALVHLSQRLFDVGILPYYLHLLDQVRGASHFEVDTTRAQQLFRELLAHLPGFLVPRLVREIPEAASKTPLPAADL